MRKRVRPTVLAAIVLPTVFFFTSLASIAAAGETETYTPSAMTVAALFALVRHAGGTLEAGAYHKVSSVRSTAGDVWTYDAYWNGDDYRTTVKQGAFTSSYGSYKGQQWRQNENGFVTLTTGYEAEADPFLASLRKPEDPGSNVKLLGLTTGEQPSFVVEITPRTGLVERNYYDAATYQLMQVREVDYDGHHRTWTYGDYRPESGTIVAHSVEYSIDGSPQMQTTLETYEHASAGSLQLTIPASRTLFSLRDGDAVTIPAQFTDYGIIVRVFIAGRGLDFMLDSGASSMLIDPGIARELGMQSSGAEKMSFGGDFTMADTMAPDFSVAGLHATDVALSTAPFTEDVPDKKIVGLLGADFVATGVLDVNFEKQTLTLRSAVPPDLKAQGWAAVPLRLDYDVPMFKAAFSGVDGYFVADLGADATMLYPHYFSHFPISIPRGTPDQGEMLFIGGKAFGIRHFTMNRLAFGDWIFGDVQVVVPSVAYAQGVDYDGLIGRTTLSNFNLMFDYKNHQLWFKPINP
jgi:hypothetical protein